MLLSFQFSSIVALAGNGSGIAEGRDLKDKSLNLAQTPNRSTKDCLIENVLLLAIPC